MQKLTWILFERETISKEKKTCHNLIFYMNFSHEEKSLLRTLEGRNVQKQICFSIDHKPQALSYLLPPQETHHGAPLYSASSGHLPYGLAV